MCAVIPEDDPYHFGKIIINGIAKLPYDVWEPAQKAKKKLIYKDGSFVVEEFVEHLVQSARVDRVGIITNYATKALDMANHLKSIKYYAKEMNAETIMFLNPKEIKKMGYDPSQYCYEMCNKSKTLYVKGFVSELKQKPQHSICGAYTFEQLDQEINYYMQLVEIDRILQGREIDGAKTGVYAEGVNGNDFIKEVKVLYTPHEMIARQYALKRPVSRSATLHKYHSFSPLGRLYTYVQYQTKEILDTLENGINMCGILWSLLTPEEKAFFNKTWIGNDKAEHTLLDIMQVRKSAYNTTLHKMNTTAAIDGDENAETVSALKEKEHAGIEAIAKYIDAPMTVMAVAAYQVAYCKDSKQNEGLTYGWILMPELLSVFSRANENYHLIRLPAKNVAKAFVKDGILYIDDNKPYIRVKAYDGPVALKTIEGAICALIHRKVDKVVKPQIDINLRTDFVYTIGTSGFKYHIGKTIDISKLDSEDVTKYKIKSAWKKAVKDNDYTFDIITDEDGRIVLSINGQSISALILNNKTDVSLYGLIGKKVKLVNNATVGNMIMPPIKETDATITDLKVIIVGEA